MKYRITLIVIATALTVLACDISSFIPGSRSSSPPPASLQASSSASVASQAPTDAPTKSAASSSATVSSAPGTSLGKNLISNGDAEARLGASNDGVTVTVPSWTTTGTFTAVQYGADGGFFEAKSAGPKEPGKNFFAGGPGGEVSTATQIINVASLASTIDIGVTYTFEGWLGGYREQDDYSVVTATFLGDGNKELGKATLGPVKADERKSQTGLLLKSSKGELPKGTRTIRITIQLTRFSGAYNDGYADNLSLILTAK